MLQLSELKWDSEHPRAYLVKGVNKERDLVKWGGHMWEDTNEIKARTPPIFDVTPPSVKEV